MLLIITNTSDATATFLESALRASNVPFVRCDTDTVVSQSQFRYRLGEPAVKLDGVWREPGVFTHVWYRRPERLKDARFDGSSEGRYALDEWSEALEGFFSHIPEERWMNHPSSNARASHKLEQLTTAVAFGLSVPDTLVTQDATLLRDFFAQHQGRLVVKPMAGGYVEREEGLDSLIYTNPVLAEHLEGLDDLVTCPTLFQQFIEKRCDVRITIIDGDVHPVALFAKDNEGDQRCDVRRNNMSDVTYSPVALPPHIESALLSLVAHYRLRFAAIDMAVSIRDEWVFFEVNPNGQWAWLDLAAQQNIASSFVRSFSEPLVTAQ